MSSSSFYSDAGNFVSAIQGGVDPRTGLFNVNLSLASLRSGHLAGPGLALALRYSPLSSQDDGFGHGFSLNLTRYDILARRLHLSTGESYPVSSTGAMVRQHKLRHFITEKSGGSITRVIHRSGLVEELVRYGFMAVTSRVTTPDGRSLAFQWDWNSAGAGVRLSAVTEYRDGREVTLCSFRYTNDPVQVATFSVLPEDPDAGYDMVFSVRDERLQSVTSHAASPALVWSFGYGNTHFSHRHLTEIRYPTGAVESVIYPDDGSAAFPDGVDLPALPRVSSHYQYPGYYRPGVTTLWTWSENNYLGRNAPGRDWSGWTPDSDIMLDVLNPDYFYSSTAKIINDMHDVLSEVTRRYNNFHQLVSESTLRDGQVHTVQTTYYARSGATMAEQPMQFQLPMRQVETWVSDTRSRSQVTRWKYDRSGNLLKEWAPDGTITECTWYPPQGMRGACPADPHGFTRHLKSRRVTPRRIQGDEVRTDTRYYWTRLDSLPGGGGGYTVLPAREVETTVLPAAEPGEKGTPRLRTRVIHDYHSDSGNRVTYGRESRRTTTFWPDVAGSSGESFTQTQDFSYAPSPDGFSQSEKLTAHDGLSLTRSTVRHPALGYLLSETDAQGVVTRYTRDKAGRVLTQTQAAGTEYESTAVCEYAISEPGLVVTATDPRGSQTKVIYDAFGRELSRQQLDADGSGNWYDTSSQTYSRLGEISTSSASDWLTESGTRYTLNTRFEYDGFGELRKQVTSDGVTVTNITDPVGLTRTVTSSGDGMTSASRTTELLPRQLLPRREVLSGGGTELVRKYKWDGHRRLREMTDENGQVTAYTWDDAGRLLTQTLPDGTVVTRTWARHLSGDNLTGISVTGKDGEGNTKTWQLGTREFDGLGRLTNSVSGGRHLLYLYEGASPVPKSVMTTSGSLIAYTRAAPLDNALMAMSASPGSGSQAPAVKQSFTRDPLTGILLTATEGSTVAENTLFPSGQLKSEQFISVSGGPRSAGYSWTLGGALSHYTDPAGKETTRVRDEHGRLIRTEDEDLTDSLSYDALGRVTTRTLTNPATQATLTTVLTYDATDRERSRTVTGSDGTTMKQTLSWSPGGQLAGRVTRSGGQEVLVEMFAYDSRNRLTEYTATGSMLPEDAYGQEITAQRCAFDALNNLITVTTTLKDGAQDVATYRYENADDPMQLTSVVHTHSAYPSSITLTYDADGRMTQDETGRLLRYDAAGRLVSTGGSPSSTFGYDALNRLVTQTVGEAEIRSLYYRGDVQVCEVKNLKEITRLIRSGHSCPGVSDDSGVTLIAADRHDSPLLSLKAGQTGGTPHVWSPYGGGTVAAGLPGFNGERGDPASGNYHPGNGYRTYSPRLMRFTCPDSLSPFGAGGINPYAYCAGDPVNFTDPSGHISSEGWIGITLGTMGLAITVLSFFLFPPAAPALLVVGLLGVVSDVTAIASGALEDVNPEASGVLGTISMVTGLAGFGAGVAYGAGGAMARISARTTDRITASQAMEMMPLRRSSASLSSTGAGNLPLPPALPLETIREIGRYLPLEDLKVFRTASRQTAEAIPVRDIIRRTSPVQRYSTVLSRGETKAALFYEEFEPFTGRILRANDFYRLNEPESGAFRAYVIERANIRAGYARSSVFNPGMPVGDITLEVSARAALFERRGRYYIDLNDLDL